MFAANTVLFIALMIICPYLTGVCVPVKRSGRAATGILENWNTGMLVMHAVFEILVLPGTFLGLSLKKVSAAWGFVLFVIIAAGAVRAVRMLRDRRQKGALRQERQREERGLPAEGRGRVYEVILLLLVAAAVLFQIVYVCTHAHYDDDDAYYVGMAVTSYYTNTISAFHPYTGAAVPLSRMANYVLSPQPVFWAMWAKITGLHPAVLMRSVLPAVYIAWCYVVYYLLAKILFRKFSRRLEFMAFVLLVSFLGGYSPASGFVFLFIRGWQGKSWLGAVFLPMFWYLWIALRREPDNRFLWFALAAAAWASCLAASSILFLGPVIFGAFGLQYLIWRRKWKPVFMLAACALPFVLLGVCELYLVWPL